jgi:hypothetical protein
LAQYAINQDTNNSHYARRVLIGTPLILALFFSLGFMTVRPGNSNTIQSASSSRPAAAKTDIADTAGPDDFAPIALAETSLPTMSQAPAVSDTSNSTAAAQASTPVAPQAAGKSTATASTSPQSATASGQSVNPKKSLSVHVNLPYSLTNFLR